MAQLTYAEVGATRDDALPAGYRHIRHRVQLPDGCFAVAAEAVLTWRLHRAAGIEMRTTSIRATPGTTVTTGAGVGPLRLWAQCEVVWVVDGPRRAGFGYGTLPGHPARGEEAFVVECDEADRVWFTVRAFSLPAGLLMRSAGPAGRAFQRGYAWWLGRTLRRLCSRAD